MLLLLSSTNTTLEMYFYDVLGNTCSWLTNTNETNVLECGDGTQCHGLRDGWGCCDDHGKRSKCPPNYPIMCNLEFGNCGAGDHCCEKQCTERNCGRYIERV